MPEPIYLDNNATTHPCDEAVAAVMRAMTELWHNPSSVHRPGQAVRRAVELARGELAALARVKSRELTLTGSGTEAIDLAIRGVLGAHAITAPPGASPPVVVASEIEHAAVRDLLEDLESRGAIAWRRWPVHAGGMVDVEALPDLLDHASGGAVLAVLQWANNETGVIQPLDAAAEACASARVPLLCDATQWIGKLPVPWEPATVTAGGPTPGVSMLAFSPHKFHGPKGVGALWVRRGVRLRPVIRGAQELGRRGGTEGVPAILGAGAAAAAAMAWLEDASARERGAAMRDRLEAGVLAACPGAVVNGVVNGLVNGSGRGGEHPRLWNTTNIGFPRLEAEALLIQLSEGRGIEGREPRGLCASAGAACSSGSLEPSPVLRAMGVPAEVAHGSLRFSLSRETTDEEIDAAVGLIAEAVRRQREMLGA